MEKFSSPTKMAATSWKAFLEKLRKAYNLGSVDIEVICHLYDDSVRTKYQLLRQMRKQDPSITETAITARLTKIYKAFELIGPKKDKLPDLCGLILDHYHRESQQTHGLGVYGLNRIHKDFPTDDFKRALQLVLSTDDPRQKHVDIMQTFAPNLDTFSEDLSACLNGDVLVRILLAWPYSRVASLREKVLKEYSAKHQSAPTDVKAGVIANLEILFAIKNNSPSASRLQIRLYDTLPSLAIYRAGDILYASPFLHGSLAVQTFQLELSLNPKDFLLVNPLRDDFDNMWGVARDFSPSSGNWHQDLRILFSDVPS
jgi:hypothetical protein